jgi:hypothetical protein
MRASPSPKAALVGLAVGLLTVGCSSEEGSPSAGNPFANPSAGSPSTGSSGSAATGGAGGAGAGGSGPGMTTAGTSNTPQTGGTGIGGMAGAAGQSMAGTTSGGMSAGGGGGLGDITKVVKSAGCGKPAAVTSGAKISIPTMGEKDANCADKLGAEKKCGLWGQPGSTWLQTPLMRDYYVNLPANYDMNKAYPLVLQGPGCGGVCTNTYPLPDLAGQVIRVGLTPPPSLIGHGTNENQGCFDDKEGDDSVDWVFYENMYDKLNQDVCFDRNRVFSGGNSSGSWFSNELGCKYAGDPTRPVRGIMPNTGGLPNEAQFAPTCTNKPMSGMWVHEVNDVTNPFAGNKVAIDRAIKVNGCMGATSYDAKVAANEVQNFVIGGNNAANTCQLLKGCPEIHPLVVCALPGNQHGGHDNVVNPGFATFVKQFSAGNFLTP